MDASSKEAVARTHAELIPAAAAAANDPTPNIREAALRLLTVFALKAGSMKPFDKVWPPKAKMCASGGTLLKLTTSRHRICVLICPDQTDAQAGIFASQYAEKLDDARKKKLEDMIAAAKSGKGLGGGATATAPAPGVGAAKACYPIWDPKTDGSGFQCRHQVCALPCLHSRPVSCSHWVCTAQAAPSVTKALSSRDTNRQPAAAPAPGKKPLRPAAPTQHQNSKPIADDDDAALQVRSALHCMVSHTMALIVSLAQPAESVYGAAKQSVCLLQMGSLSKAEVEEKLGQLVGDDITSKLKSANWKERLEGMEQLQCRVRDLKENTDAPILIQACSHCRHSTVCASAAPRMALAGLSFVLPAPADWELADHAGALPPAGLGREELPGPWQSL